MSEMVTEPATSQSSDTYPTRDEMHHEVTLLREQVISLTDENRALKRFVSTLNVALNETAERREWCSEYDDIIGRFWADNAPSGVPFIGRAREYHVEVTATGTLTASRTITVMAASEEQALEMADDEFSADDLLTSAARDVCFEDIHVEVDIL